MKLFPAGFKSCALLFFLPFLSQNYRLNKAIKFARRQKVGLSLDFHALSNHKKNLKNRLRWIFYSTPFPCVILISTAYAKSR